MNNNVNLILVRHGESYANVKKIVSCKLPGAYITLLGKKQTKEFVNRLAKIFSVDLIVTSPFIRAVSTANIICKKLDIKEVLIEKRLSEYNFGKWDGKAGKDMGNELIEVLELSKNGFIDIRVGENGETQREFLHRVYNFLCKCGDKYRGTILAVTHGSVISVSANIYEKITHRIVKIESTKNAEYIHLVLNKKIVKSIQKELLELDYNHAKK